MKARCSGAHTAPAHVSARALVTRCTRCETVIPVPKRRHLAAVPPLQPAAPSAPRKRREPSAREKLIRSDFQDYLDYLEQTSEINLNGHLYSAAGRAAAEAGRIRQRDLYTRPWHQVRRYASEELQDFFAEFGRMSWTEYRAQFKNERQESA